MAPGSVRGSAFSADGEAVVVGDFASSSCCRLDLGKARETVCENGRVDSGRIDDLRHDILDRHRSIVSSISVGEALARHCK